MPLCLLSVSTVIGLLAGGVSLVFDASYPAALVLYFLSSAVAFILILRAGRGY